MRVLLTGGSGFLGRHVKAYLALYTDWEVVAPNTDLTQPFNMQGHFDYIINLASKSSVEESVRDSAKFIQDNVAMVTNILEYASQNKPSVFLHFSTVEVYNVTNPYAASKAAQEAIVEAYWKTFDIPVVIARSTNIIGAGQTRDKFVPKIIEMIKEGEEVPIYTLNGNQGKRVYNTAYNVADAIHYLLTKYKKQDHDWTSLPAHFDINGGTELTNLEMAEMIAKCLDKVLDYTLVEPTYSRPTYAQNLRPSATNLTDIGWKPPQTLDEGLAWIE